ncbi:MAG: HNH endonuclease [Corynebacterium sp.]|uniref:HNH endonuclease n=1 Tax=Corynebacterium sp. TaxID=1720 RepID=UPI0026E0E8AB|nr:HNH endonuclease [Corynebacterium sp.]MDO5670111.1 HNH endonuclease [Corynebacterium sp.]
MARIGWSYEEVVLAADLVARNNWQGLRATNPLVLELSQLLQAATIHPVEDRESSFRSVNSVQRKTFDIATQHPDYDGAPTKGGPFDAEVLLEFIAEPERMAALARVIRGQIAVGPHLPPPDTDMEILTAREGRLQAVLHLRRERSPKLRKAKLAAVLAAGGTLGCEVCGFDFKARYGVLGDGYVEVHHTLPLHASGPVETRLEDLALLCSNCHRMIHRAQPWLTPCQLATRLITHR